MSFLTKQELEEIVSSGDFDRLIGKYENEWFDCKKEPYKLDNEKGKHELAKDISSFANVDGGYILIGLKGENNQSHSGEQIKEISLFGENLVNIEQNKKIIEERIYPIINDLNVNWYPSKKDNNKGLIFIKIPPQKESDKPFLCKRIFDENENKISETMFGLFQRRGDVSSHYELKDLHRLIQLGRHYEQNVGNRFDALELMLKEVSEVSLKEHFEKTKKTFDTRIEERIVATLTKTNQIEKPNLVLSAYVDGNCKIEEFGISGKMSNLIQKTTQPLRDGGWKLLYSTSLISNSPSLIEMGYNSKSLSIFNDGTTIYISNIDQFSSVNNWSQIIPIALIEVVYQFAEFYKQLIDYVEGNFNKIFVKIELNNLVNDDSRICLSWDLRPNHHYSSYIAPENSVKFEIAIDKNFEPKVLAFQVIKAIYQWFNINQTPPFSKNEDGVDMIDINKITH